MGKVTILFALVSTVVLLVAFGNGMSVVRGGDPMSHAQWAMAALLCSLATNFVAMIHAAQSDRIIRALRLQIGTELETSEGRK